MRVQLGNLLVRDLAEEDSTLLGKWLSDASVLEFYGGRDRVYDLEKVKEHFYNDDEDEYRCIVEYDGAAIGYIQFYPITEKERQKYGYDDNQVSVFGMDQFIGEPEYWNRGIGSLLVSGTRDYIISLGVDAIVMDPQAWNHRALRCYEKCGFVRKKLLLQHEWHEGAMRDCWLIEYKIK